MFRSGSGASTGRAALRRLVPILELFVASCRLVRVGKVGERVNKHAKKERVCECDM